MMSQFHPVGSTAGVLTIFFPATIGLCTVAFVSMSPMVSCWMSTFPGDESPDYSMCRAGWHFVFDDAFLAIILNDKLHCVGIAFVRSVEK
jgi:hypothetical protein